MSETFRAAIVAEGPTDRIVIEAAMSRVLGEKAFILRQIQPEESSAFPQSLGRGWSGVYRWCRQASARAGGAIRNDPLFATYDLLILHLDADVANASYADAGIINAANDLPCNLPCPPASDSTNSLRNVMLRWIGEASAPPKTILCTPSKITEAWVLCALYPTDQIATSGDVECNAHPDHRLQSKPSSRRLVSGGRKIRRMYELRAPEIARSWHRVRALCSEAERFSAELDTLIRTATGHAH